MQMHYSPNHFHNSAIISLTTIIILLQNLEHGEMLNYTSIMENHPFHFLVVGLPSLIT